VKTIVELLQNDVFFISDKADGFLVLLIQDEFDNLFAITQYRRFLVIEMKKAVKKIIQKHLFLGEFLDMNEGTAPSSKEPQNRGLQKIKIFDCMLFDKKDVTKESYQKRIDRIPFPELLYSRSEEPSNSKTDPSSQSVVFKGNIQKLSRG